MNHYIVYVTGSDAIGYSFMKNVTELAGKGASLQEGKIPCMRFPHSAFMTYKTDELMEDSPGFRYQIIHEQYTKEQLDEMEWEDLKKLIKKATGKTGRDRQLLSNYYLKVMSGEEPEAE